MAGRQRHHDLGGSGQRRRQDRREPGQELAEAVIAVPDGNDHREVGLGLD
jgi:hypothetical protein